MPEEEVPEEVVPEEVVPEEVVPVEVVPMEMGGMAAEPGEKPGRLPDQSPAAWASPRAARRSRNLPASSGCSPRIRASVEAAAVCSLTFTSPKDLSMGPATRSTSCIRP